jgi:hypothetical protein
MNIVHSLAGGDPLKYEAVWELPWATVHTARVIKLEEYLFNKRLNEIRSEKAKRQ